MPQLVADVSVEAATAAVAAVAWEQSVGVTPGRCGAVIAAENLWKTLGQR